MARKDRLPWYSKPRVILAFTVPLAFLGIILGKSFNADAEIDATIAGGLIAILGAIVAGCFQSSWSPPKKKDDDDTNRSSSGPS